MPGRSGAPPGLESYFLAFFFDFDFFAFFAFFAFLAIASSFGFNGRKRDTRHARRRASLATSSNAIPTDSRRPAPHCHAGVIALSTAVMRFGAFLESFRSSSPGLTWLDPGNRSNRQSKMARRIKSGDDTVQTIALPAPLGRVNDAATCRRILRRSGTAPGYLHDFKTTARIAARR